MTDRDLLLRAVLANPDEDAPRLMYADSLLERNRFVPAGSGLTDDRVIADRIRRSIEEGWEPQRIDHTAQWWPLPVGAVGRYHRGFYDRIECTAADWLAHADALAWSPEQTVECPQIKWRVVAGTVDPGTRKRAVRDGLSGPCPKWCNGGCSGTGRVARPCPPTAEPITAVVLTTTMDAYLTCHGTGDWNDYPHAAVFWLPGRAKWSGAELNLGVADDGTEYRDMRYPQWSRHVFSRLIRAGWPHVAFTLPPA